MPVWSGPRRKLLAGGREEGLGQGRFCSSQLPKALPAVTAPHLLQKLSCSHHLQTCWSIFLPGEPL